MPLNPPTSKIFWKKLQGPEVLPKFFTFGFLSNDSKANIFTKQLKKRNSEQVSQLHVLCKVNRTEPGSPPRMIFYFCVLVEGGHPGLMSLSVSSQLCPCTMASNTGYDSAVFNRYSEKVTPEWLTIPRINLLTTLHWPSKANLAERRTWSEDQQPFLEWQGVLTIIFSVPKTSYTPGTTRGRTESCIDLWISSKSRENSG